MRRRLILMVLVLACLGGAAVGSAAVIGSDTPDAPVLPEADRYVAPGGDDGRDCRSKAQPCASLDAAYRAADPGEVVEVAEGTYPEQKIVVDPAKTSSRHVTIRPAKGARVVVSGLTLGADERGNGPRHLTIEGLHTAYATPESQLPVVALPGTEDVTLRRLDAGNFNLWGVKGVRVEGGDWGPCAIGPEAPCSNAKIDAGAAGLETDRVTISGAKFHDYRFSRACYEEGADCHFECMYINGSSNVTVRHSTFRDCALFDIFVTVSGPDAGRVGHRNLKIVGNVFDTPWDEAEEGAERSRATALSFNFCQSSPVGYQDVLIAHNSFQDGTGIMNDLVPECQVENIKVVGNVLAFTGCDARWTYAYNVWGPGAGRGHCAKTDREAGAKLPYARAISGRGFDFSLRNGKTPADALVPAEAGPCPQRDINGHKRPREGRCDAGAYEREAG